MQTLAFRHGQMTRTVCSKHMPGFAPPATCRRKYARGEMDYSLLGNVNTALRHRYLQDVHPHYHRSASYKSVVGSFVKLQNTLVILSAFRTWKHWESCQIFKIFVKRKTKKRKQGKCNETKKGHNFLFKHILTSKTISKVPKTISSIFYAFWYACTWVSCLIFYRAALFPSRGNIFFLPIWNVQFYACRGV